MDSILNETKYIMKKYNISANKSLGQNFLVDDSVINNIIDSAKISENDLIIEIGPGLGTLTSRILEKAGKVIAIELDTRMIEILKNRFITYNNFEVLNKDILKVNLKELINDNKDNFPNVKIVANLPYYITTPIIMKLLEDRLNIESITVMVQKEVADRIVAIPGEKNSGAITYSVYYYAISNSVCFVSRESFIPSPEVDSEVIQLCIRKEPHIKVQNEEMFFKVIKASFMQRRKTILNGLINSGLIKNKEEGKAILEKLDIPRNIRGEKLTIDQFAQISDEIDTK